MNVALEQLASTIRLGESRHERLRLAFAFSCTSRVRHLLEEPEVAKCLVVLGRFLEGKASRQELDAARADAVRLAGSHPGSVSIDGCGHAAVSASYAVARALEAKALESASYAAYATVYAQGGAAAVADRAAFEPEFCWQLASLTALAECTADAQGLIP